MAPKAPTSKTARHDATLAGRLDWLCYAIHADCACAAENRAAACDAWECQLDLALLCFARGDDAAALAICERLEEEIPDTARGQTAQTEAEAS